MLYEVITGDAVAVAIEGTRIAVEVGGEDGSQIGAGVKLATLGGNDDALNTTSALTTGIARNNFV